MAAVVRDSDSIVPSTTFIVGTSSDLIVPSTTFYVGTSLCICWYLYRVLYFPSNSLLFVFFYSLYRHPADLVKLFGCPGVYAS